MESLKPEQTHILVVDDDEAARNLLGTVLGINGYTVRAAASGEEALAAVTQRLPDLILLDVMMTGIDGFEVARRLKANSSTSHVPIIMVTSMDDRTSRLEALEAGAEEFLTKPVDRAELLVRISNLLKIKEYNDFLANYSRLLEQQVEASTAELRESEARYRRITEGLTDYLYTVRIEDGRAVETTQSPACVAVTGYTAEEFAANPCLWIEMVVPEDREIVTEHVRQIMAGNDGTPIEHRIIRKNGEIRWISDTSILFRDASGKLLSYDGVIRDITLLKRAEQEQQQNAAINAALAELAQFFLSTRQMNIEDISARVLSVARQLTGSEFGSVGYIDVTSGFLISPTLTRDIWERCKVAGKSVVFEKWGGLWGWVLNNKKSLLSNSPSADPRSGGIPQGHVPIANFISAPALAGEELVGQICLANADRDYTDRDMVIVEHLADFYAIVVQRMRNETLLRENEEKFRAIFEGAIDGILLADIMTRQLITGNPEICRMLGYSSEELTHLGVADIHPPQDLPYIMSQFEKRLRNECQLAANIPLRRKDGTVFYADIKSSPVDFGGKKYLMGVFRDITERRQAETEIRHANRALACLSDMNSKLVHATDEMELLQNICQSIVEHSGYRMAWVGYAQHDEGKSIRIMASAGQDEGYLDALQLTWAETERGMCTCGCTIRSGATQICQDIAHDPRHLPWRDAALERGYAASIALPLARRSGKIFGTLAVYSDEVNAFSPAEVALLEEMAGDLAFGVRTLQIRHERNLAQEKIRQQLAQLQDSLDDTVKAISTMLEMRDPYTAGHQVRVAELAAAIARQMGLSDEQIHGIHLAGMLHDLGKIQIPSEILSKPGKISAAEFGLIKLHPQAGHDILQGIDFPWPIALMVLQHHERMDGTGYPQGLKGEAILLGARILSVADVVEAMTSHRPYRPGLGIETALEEITRQRGIYFDPQVVDACLTLFREQRYTL